MSILSAKDFLGFYAMAVGFEDNHAQLSLVSAHSYSWPIAVNHGIAKASYWRALFLNQYFIFFTGLKHDSVRKLISLIFSPIDKDLFVVHAAHKRKFTRRQVVWIGLLPALSERSERKIVI